MVTRVVVLFTCDICKTTATEEHIPEHKAEHAPLPKTWSMLEGFTNGKQVLNLQLCPDCMKSIVDAVEESEEIAERNLKTLSAHPGAQGS